MIDLRIMKKIKKYALGFLAAAMAMVLVGTAAPVYAAGKSGSNGGASTCKTHVLTFPAWYDGVVDKDCNIKIDQLNDFWVIVMNFIEILLQLVAYVSAGFIIWGGIKYIKSEGDPSKISEAKSAIMNAIFGLVIAFASVAIVEFIQGRIV
jgi:hypothetical protein